MIDNSAIGHKMHNLMTKLFPICRSITGDGVRETLKIIANDVLSLTMHDIPSGTKVFDWTIPKEWNIRDAFVADENGTKIIDFKNNNLHLVGYSLPIDKHVSLFELQEHLYSLPEQPDAIPYITSYYQERWGFCISHNERKKLKEGMYHVFIDSSLTDGFLTYGECIIPGETKQEIFLSTYVCHPSMANNELSGPIVTAFIGQWLMSKPRKYTYRLIFIPETIGSISYLSHNMKALKQNVIAGFNISCIGDERDYSYVASRYENTLADKIVSYVLSTKYHDFTKHSFLNRGSDERQYCSPRVDLPLVTLSRSKYGTFPEYHTSLDDLTLVTPKGLSGGFEFVKKCISTLENNEIPKNSSDEIRKTNHNEDPIREVTTRENQKYRMTCYGEPQLGKRGLYPNLSNNIFDSSVSTMMDFIAYADGTNNLFEIGKIIGKSIDELTPIAEKLIDEGLLEEVK